MSQCHAPMETSSHTRQSFHSRSFFFELRASIVAEQEPIDGDFIFKHPEDHPSEAAVNPLRSRMAFLFLKAPSFSVYYCCDWSLIFIRWHICDINRKRQLTAVQWHVRISDLHDWVSMRVRNVIRHSCSCIPHVLHRERRSPSSSGG